MWFISAWNRHWTKCWINYYYFGPIFLGIAIINLNFSEIGLCFTKLDNCIWVYIFIYYFETLLSSIMHCLQCCGLYMGRWLSCFPFLTVYLLHMFCPRTLGALSSNSYKSFVYISLVVLSESGLDLWAFTLPSPPIMLSARSLRVEVCDIS